MLHSHVLLRCIHILYMYFYVWIVYYFYIKLSPLFHWFHIKKLYHIHSRVKFFNVKSRELWLVFHAKMIFNSYKNNIDYAWMRHRRSCECVITYFTYKEEILRCKCYVHMYFYYVLIYYMRFLYVNCMLIQYQGVTIIPWISY